MGEMREIIDLDTVNRLFTLLAFVGPLVGVVVGGAFGARQGELRRGLRTGLLIGLVGTLNWIMWHLYNAITDRNGLDTVRNLFLNLGLFVALGLGLGLAVRRFQAPRPTEETSSEPPQDTTP